jgi:ABC-type phosphate transport system substrate-binding protein
MTMRISMKGLMSALAATVMLAAPAVVRAQDFKVVVNSGNAVDALSADEASKIFLKQSAKFANGTAAAPVDQKGAARASFTKAVHGKAVAAIDTYWQQQIFSGKEVPPPTKASDDEVIAFVKSNPGGIGYVSAGAATAGVKVVAIK